MKGRFGCGKNSTNIFLFLIITIAFIMGWLFSLKINYDIEIRKQNILY